MSKIKLIFGFLTLYASILRTHAADTISANQILRYNQTITSPQETFELGFFSPPNSTNHYVGIWYKKISSGTVVWVANRNTPLTDTSGELTLTLQGVLILRDATKGNVVWSSTNSPTMSKKNPIGQLLDTGNFIVHEEGEGINQEDPVWQSFDFITDTLLPGMKQGWNLMTGLERRFTSWRSPNDPAFVNQREIYYQYNPIDTSIITRLVLQPSGRIERLVWIDSKQEWSLYMAAEIDHCNQYALCGPFGRCSIDKSPVCECLEGFQPTSPDQWRDTDWSQGCQHSVPLDCNPGEGFNKYLNLKLPDTRGSWYNHTMTLVECEQMCKSNCSCTAYANSNISGRGSGCFLWFGGLIDIRTIADDGDTIYIRLSASELESIEDSNSSSPGRRPIRIIVPMASVVLVILISIYLFYHFNRKKQQQKGMNFEY
ncbi:putative non-specific serine/threonine protein kinase [Helianthus annuus]|nr:putative non-specific serine/threonine protein kinase [Helianthus annuus]